MSFNHQPLKNDEVLVLAEGLGGDNTSTIDVTQRIVRRDKEGFEVSTQFRYNALPDGHVNFTKYFPVPPGKKLDDVYHAASNQWRELCYDLQDTKEIAESYMNLKGGNNLNPLQKHACLSKVIGDYADKYCQNFKTYPAFASKKKRKEKFPVLLDTEIIDACREGIMSLPHVKGAKLDSFEEALLALAKQTNSLGMEYLDMIEKCKDVSTPILNKPLYERIVALTDNIDMAIDMCSKAWLAVAEKAPNPSEAMDYKTRVEKLRKNIAAVESAHRELQDALEFHPAITTAAPEEKTFNDTLKALVHGTKESKGIIHHMNFLVGAMSNLSRMRSTIESGFQTGHGLA